MNYAQLDLELQTKTEIEVARLLTCNFDSASVANISAYINDDAFVELLQNIIKFRKHLTLEPTTFKDLKDKIILLLSNSKQDFVGQASRIVGYSGTHLRNAKSLADLNGELISFNEYDYVFTYFPWNIRAVNPVFQERINLGSTTQEFLCLSTFDIESLKELDDVRDIVGDKIILNDGRKIPIVVIEK